MASPFTQRDDAGDCRPSKCDLTSIRVVNDLAGLKLVATYAGTPYLPVTQPNLSPPPLVWYIRGTSDRLVFVRAVSSPSVPLIPIASVCQSGCAYWSQATSPNIVCESLNDGNIPVPVVSGRRVTVVVPWSCLGFSGEVHVRAVVTSDLDQLLQKRDRAPDRGYTPAVGIGVWQTS